MSALVEVSRDLTMWLNDWLPLAEVQLLLAIPLFVGSLAFFTRMRSWPATVQLIGAAAWLVHNILWSFVGFMATQPDFWLHRIIYPTDAVAPGIDYADDTLRIIALCFPVGFLFAMLRIRKHLTNR